MGGIHEHVFASGKGAVDSPMEKGFQFSPRPLDLRVPPKLCPESVTGDHPCREQRSKHPGEAGFATARGADYQMALWK